MERGTGEKSMRKWTKWSQPKPECWVFSNSRLRCGRKGTKGIPPEPEQRGLVWRNTYHSGLRGLHFSHVHIFLPPHSLNSHHHFAHSAAYCGREPCIMVPPVCLLSRKGSECSTAVFCSIAIRDVMVNLGLGFRRALS